MSDFSPVRKLMERFGLPNNREEYIRLNWLGAYKPDEELPAELEADMPDPFNRQVLEENVLTEEEQ